MTNFTYFTKLQQLCAKANLHPQFGHLLDHLNHPEAERKCQEIFTDMVRAYQSAKATAESPRKLSQELKTLLSSKLRFEGH